jgi:hypothetical protein
MLSTGKGLSSDNEMGRDSDDDNDDGSGVGVRDKKGGNGRTSASSSKSLILASGDGNTSGRAVTIDGVDGSMALGCSITISLGVGFATSLGSIAILARNAGRAGALGDLSLNTGTASVGDSGALDIGRGLSASGLGGGSAISVGSSTDI